MSEGLRSLQLVDERNDFLNNRGANPYKSEQNSDFALKLSQLIKLDDTGGAASPWVALLVPDSYQIIYTAKGNFLVDAPAIIDAFKRGGNDIVIDYEHKSLEGEVSPAAGWITELEVYDNGDLYAKVEWTQRAAGFIKNREYRYLSPTIMLSDKRVTSIHSVALTNTPATYSAVPVRLSNSGEWEEDKHPREEDGKFAEGEEEAKSTPPPTYADDKGDIELKGDELGSYSDIKELRNKAANYYKKHLQKRKLEREELGVVRFSDKGIDKTTSRSNEDKLKAIPAVWDIIKTGEIGAEETPKHPRNDGIVGFIPVSKSVKLAGKQRDIEVLLGKDGFGNLYYDLYTDNFRNKKALSATPGEKSGLHQRLYGTTLSSTEQTVNIFFNASCGGEEKSQMKKILEVLGLSVDATEDAACTAIQALKEVRDKAVTALSLTAAATAGEVEGKIVALSGNSTQLEDLQKKVVALNNSIKERDARELVKVALSEGKLAPAQEAWALGYAAENPEGFKAWAGAAVPVTALSNGLTPVKTESLSSGAAEVEILKGCGISKADFEKYGKEQKSTLGW